MREAIGLMEFNSIAKGIEVTDTLLKASEVKLLFSSSICPGKYLIIITGEVAAVRNSIDDGKKISAGFLIDVNVIPQVHEKVFPAIAGTTDITEMGAVGVIDAYSSVSAVVAADKAVKTADVELVEVRLARALGGKAFVIITGEVADVRSAVQGGVDAIKEEGLLLGTVIIPSPHPELKNILM
jgi:microcompartment protein CcmL/EutN